MLAKSSTRPAVVRRCAATGATALALVGAGLPAAASNSTGPDLTRFYGQKVTWSKCRGEDMPKDLQCGKVTVPLDYDRPASGTLDLALDRYRSTGRKRRLHTVAAERPGAAAASPEATPWRPHYSCGTAGS